MEFIRPAVAEVKWFSKSCPFQHCSSKADLWLRLRFTPFFSFLPPPSFSLSAGHRAPYVRAEMSFTLPPFTTVFLFSSPLLFPPSPLPSLPFAEATGLSECEQLFLTRSIFFFFYLRFPRINSPVAHPTQPINFFPPCPMPALVVFEGKKKEKKEKPIGVFGHLNRESLQPRHPPSRSISPLSGKRIFILARSFDYSNNSVWLHLKCRLAQLWKCCQLVLERRLVRVCVCVCSQEWERDRDISRGGEGCYWCRTETKLQ